MRYFMYKYMIQEYDWYESININYKKINSYFICCRISMQIFSVMQLSSENYVNRETRVVICYLVFIEMLYIK